MPKFLGVGPAVTPAAPSASSASSPVRSPVRSPHGRQNENLRAIAAAGNEVNRDLSPSFNRAGSDSHLSNVPEELGSTLGESTLRALGNGDDIQSNVGALARRPPPELDTLPGTPGEVSVKSHPSMGHVVTTQSYMGLDMDETVSGQGTVAMATTAGHSGRGKSVHDNSGRNDADLAVAIAGDQDRGNSPFRPQTLDQEASQVYNSEEVCLEPDIDIEMVNKTGMMRGLGFAITWVFISAGVLFALVWLFAQYEVDKLEELTTAVAVDRARVDTAEALRPAVTAISAVQAAFEMEALESMSEYTNLSRLLEPHFEARSNLREIEIVAVQGIPLLGSVVFSPARHGGLEIQMDRQDCNTLEPRRVCTLESLKANESNWFKQAYGIGVDWWNRMPPAFWYGPDFLHDTPQDIECEELCWSPSIAFIAKVAAGRAGSSNGQMSDETTSTPRVAAQPTLSPDADANEEATLVESTTVTTTTTTTTTIPPAPEVLIRASTASSALQSMVQRLEELSRGEVFLCTSDGEVLVGADMGDALQVDLTTGAIRPAYIWELGRAWVGEDSKERKELQDMIRKGRSDVVVSHSNTRITAHTLNGPTLDMEAMGYNMRVLLAVPGYAFLDEVMGPLVEYSVATVAVILSLTALAAYIMFCVARR